jgi:hypothetical protein
MTDPHSVAHAPDDHAEGMPVEGPAEKFAIHVIACGHCRSFPRSLCPVGAELLEKVDSGCEWRPSGASAPVLRESGPVEHFAIHVIGCRVCKKVPSQLCTMGKALLADITQKALARSQLTQ